MGQKIVIIGGVACGPKAAARARRRDPEAEITIIERKPHVSYASCGLPYYVGGVVPDIDKLISTTHGTFRDPDYFHHVKNINAMINTEALAIDRDKKEVRIKDLQTGNESSLPYDQLVLSTGASPQVPPLPGADLDRIWNLWSMKDAQVIREKIEAGEADRICVIGAGLIGIESCEALMNQAVDTHLVDIMPQVLYGPLDQDMAELVSYALREENIEICLCQGVKSFEGENGQVKKVITEAGEIETDAVILAMGAKPNIELAKDSGLDIGDLGAIKVDEYLKTNDPHIFAGGDCVENHHLVTGQKTWNPLGSTANMHGRVIGDNLTGMDSTFPGVLGTGIMKTLGTNVGYTGITDSKAGELGFDTVTGINTANDKSHFFPGGKDLAIKLVADKTTRRVLGCQVVGAGDVARVVDAAASALRYGATLEDLAYMDFCYAPPFGAPVTPLANAANIALNKLSGMAETISAFELFELLGSDRDFVMIDVRTQGELKARPPIEDKRSIAIDMHEIRQKADELPRDKPLIIICQLGQRSYEVLQMLKGKGFQNAKSLEGGLRIFTRTTKPESDKQ
ncbi:MAG: FAD-dependent oxidoreductase [bacterium]